MTMSKGVAVQVDDSMHSSSNESCTVYGNRCGNDKRLDDLLLCTLLTSWNSSSLCLKHLTLRSHSISDSGFEAICTYIYGFNDPILRTLDLEGNDITGSCIGKLDLGSSRCSIELLNLSSNKLGVEGGRVIAESLITNASLQHLFLNNCEFPLNTVILLTTSIVSLELEHSPTIQRVCPLVTLELDRPLLWCESNKQEEGSEHLSRLMMLASKSPLSSLSLKYFNMQNFGAQILSESMYRSCGSIISLNCECNSIGVAGAEAIATFVILQSQSQDKKFKSLRVLKLSNNKISNEGAVAMAEALSSNTSLEELTLKNNGISSTGLVALGKALENNNTLGRLTLFGNDFDMESGKIFNDLQNNRFTYLNISIDIQVYIIDGKYMIAEKLDMVAQKSA